MHNPQPSPETAAYVASLGDGWQAPETTRVKGKVEIAVRCPSEPSAAHARNLLGYYLRASHGTTTNGFDSRDSTNGHVDGAEWRFQVDFASATRQRDGHDLSDLAEFLTEGSPIRRSNLRGEGTAGTRKYSGVGPCVVAVRPIS